MVKGGGVVASVGLGRLYGRSDRAVKNNEPRRFDFDATTLKVSSDDPSNRLDVASTAAQNAAQPPEMLQSRLTSAKRCERCGALRINLLR